MTRNSTRWVASCGVCILAIGLPGIPGLPPAQNVIQGAAVQEATKALGVTLTEDAPIHLNPAAAYPKVAQLPGAPFGTSAAGGAHVAPDGSITLGAGDYHLGVEVFCMAAHRHSPMQNTFFLAPLQGKWADIISAVQTRGTLAGIPHPDLQMLSWQLQGGLKYQELSARSRALVDELIPEDRHRLNESYLEQIQSTWNNYVSKIPGTPSLDSMLGQMGDVGKAILQVEADRNTLIGYQNDYQYVANLFAPLGSSGHENGLSTLWSALGPQVYGRLIMAGTYHGPGVLEVRVLSGAAVKLPFRLASTTALGRDVGPLVQSDGVPGGMVGLPNASVQPMGIAPDAPTPGPSPTPTSPCDPSATGSATDFYGVPSGSVMRPFLHGGTHPGIDVQRVRDAPVFVNLRDSIPLTELNSATMLSTKTASGLNVSGSGDAQLQDATVIVQQWSSQDSCCYGGIIDLAAHYTFTANDGSTKTLTLDVEYEHLITPNFLPRKDDGTTYIDNQGKPIAPGDYITKQLGCTGFGKLMTNGAKLTAQQLDSHPLVGYLGATVSPHVHIRASSALGSTGYIQSDQFDPGVVVVH